LHGGNQEQRLPFDDSGCGWTCDTDDTFREIDFWKLTFPREIVTYIVNESNSYALYVMGKGATLSRRQNKFKPITEDEFLRYLTIRIIMGIDQKPEMSMYWSKDPILGSIAIRDIMSSDRFFEIQRYLHLSDAENVDETDKIFKVRKTWDMVMQNFKQLIIPFDSLSVDESLVKCKGRIGIRQFIPSKRNRFGIKTYSVVDEKTGFVINSIIYEGKASSKNYEVVSPSIKKRFGHGGGIILHLCEPFLGKNRTVFADNFFTSPNLAEKLLKERTYLCGTLRAGRLNAPKPPKKMKQGDVDVHHDEEDNQIMVEFWRDKRIVKMISSGFEHGMVETQNALGTTKQKLKTIVAYNHQARGIDRGDQLIHLYDSGRKTMKWYICQFVITNPDRN